LQYQGSQIQNLQRFVCLEVTHKIIIILKIIIIIKIIILIIIIVIIKINNKTEMKLIRSNNSYHKRKNIR